MNAFTDAALELPATSIRQHVTIYALGLQLGMMRRESHLLDILTTRMGGEDSNSPMDAKRLAQRHASTAQDAVTEQCYALEDLILSSRAQDAADAVVQVLITAARLDRLTGAPDRASAEAEERRLWRALQGATRALAQATGVQLDDLGGRFYASSWCDPWPEVDLSIVHTGEDSIDRCIDGTGAA